MICHWITHWVVKWGSYWLLSKHLCLIVFSNKFLETYEVPSTFKLCGLVIAQVQRSIRLPEKYLSTSCSQMIFLWGGGGDLDSRNVARCECLCFWAQLLFGTGFVQDRYLSDGAAFVEKCTPSFTVAEITLSLPLPEPFLQLRLHLKNKSTLVLLHPLWLFYSLFEHALEYPLKLIPKMVLLGGKIDIHQSFTISPGSREASIGRLLALTKSPFVSAQFDCLAI